mgnify:CR=1 FL=1
MPEDGDCDESDDGDEEDADDLIATSARHARKGVNGRGLPNR